MSILSNSFWFIFQWLKVSFDEVDHKVQVFAFEKVWFNDQELLMNYDLIKEVYVDYYLNEKSFLDVQFKSSCYWLSCLRRNFWVKNHSFIHSQPQVMQEKGFNLESEELFFTKFKQRVRKSIMNRRSRAFQFQSIFKAWKCLDLQVFLMNQTLFNQSYLV